MAAAASPSSSRRIRCCVISQTVRRLSAGRDPPGSSSSSSRLRRRTCPALAPRGYQPAPCLRLRFPWPFESVSATPRLASLGSESWLENHAMAHRVSASNSPSCSARISSSIWLRSSAKADRTDIWGPVGFHYPGVTEEKTAMPGPIDAAPRRARSTGAMLPCSEPSVNASGNSDREFTDEVLPSRQRCFGEGAADEPRVQPRTQAHSSPYSHSSLLYFAAHRPCAGHSEASLQKTGDSIVSHPGGGNFCPSSRTVHLGFSAC